jgi:hypothetical protein
VTIDLVETELSQLQPPNESRRILQLLSLQIRCAQDPPMGNFRLHVSANFKSERGPVALSRPFPEAPHDGHERAGGIGDDLGQSCPKSSNSDLRISLFDEG